MFLGYIDPGSGFNIFSAGAWFVAFCLGFFGIFLLLLRRISVFFRRYKRALIVIIISVVAVTGISIIGATMARKECGFDKKIIVLGFDGLSPEIIEPLMRENKLPNFYKLKEKGSYRRLSTANPSQSPVVWAVFATGQNPATNGTFDFIVRNPKNYSLRLSLADIQRSRPRRVIKTKCFWQYASEKKIPTTIITCPVTFPPDKIYGRMLSGMGVPDILGTEGTFIFYTSEPFKQDKDIGGKVYRIRKSSSMIMHLIGPQLVSFGGKADNVKVPFKAILQPDKESVIIAYQNSKFALKVGQWSDWKEVVFKLGPFRKVKGILKFYLVETEPEFKLYISPVNFDPRSPFFPISQPEKYSRELAGKIGLYYTQGEPFHTWAVNEGRLGEEPFLSEAEEVTREKEAMLDFELKRFKRGILFCYFESSDIIQHMFWRYIDPQHPLYDKDAPPQYKECIENWYKKLDDILGDTMKNINEDDTLIVLSDHGFDSFRRAVHLNSWLRENGFLALKNPDADNGAELLRDVDWPKTKAYAISFGAIYINQLGREARGTVKPGEETELIKEEIIEKLRRWRDDKYGNDVVNEVYRREDIFRGAYFDQTPDLYVGFNKGYRASWQTALGAAPKELIEDNLKKWSGDHLFDPALVPGVIFANRKIAKQNPSIYDIAPTILSVIGVEVKGNDKRGLEGEDLFH